MMDSLRNFLTGPRLFIVIAVCTLPFVFLGTSSLSSTFTPNIGSINGEDISESDLRIASNSIFQRYSEILGEDFEFELLDPQVREQAIKQELIVQKFLLSSSRSLGLINSFSQEEAKRLILQNPQFQIDGVFDEFVYEAQVNSNGFTKASYIELMTNLVATELYRNAISTLSFSTPFENKQIVALLEQSSDIDFYKISYDDLKNEIVNSTEELIEYYDNNSIQFYTNERRDFKFITFSADDYRDKVVIPEGYIDNTYEDYIQRSGERSQIRFAHIMIDKKNYESNSEAFIAMQEIEKLIAEGQDFSELVSEYSEDIVTKENGGDLEYFDPDFFPEEFGKSIESMSLNQTSPIIELDDTLHILKITEMIIDDPLPEDEAKENFANDLIKAESIALLGDDLSIADDLIFNGNNIQEISTNFQKELQLNDLQSENEFEFDFSFLEVKEAIYGPSAELGKVHLINLDDRFILVELNSIEEPYLLNFEEVAEKAADLLVQYKANEKINLIGDEILSIENEDDIENFISAYSFIKKDSFVGIKRFSSILPNEVVRDIFTKNEGTRFISDANNKDKYLINILKFSSPSDTEIENLLTQYTSFNKERVTSLVSDIINKDVFDNARVNLNMENIVF